MKVATTGLSSG